MKKTQKINLKKLTKKQAIKLHRELWDWIAAHPLEDKMAWPGWGEYGYCFNDCIFCHYSMVIKGASCEKCPALGKWAPGYFGFGALPTPMSECCAPRSPYTQWKVAKGTHDKERAWLSALAMRDIMKGGKK